MNHQYTISQPQAQTSTVATSGHQPKPKKINSADQHVYIQAVLNQEFYVERNRHGTAIFVNKWTSHAYCPDNPHLMNQLMFILQQTFVTNPSRSAIQNAIDATKGNYHAHTTLYPLFQRVVAQERAIWITCARINQAWYVRDDHAPTLLSLQDYASCTPSAPSMHMPPAYKVSPDELHMLTPDQDQKADFDKLFELTNIPRKYKTMIAAWLVLSLLPLRRQVLLEFTGPSGTGKSHAQKTLRHLIDPNVSVIDNPTKPQHIHSKLMNSYVLLIDRVERLDTASQQLLMECLDKHVYSAGAKTKDHSPVDITRPVLVNGTESVVTDSTLERRTISIPLDTTPDRDKLARLPASHLDATPQELYPVFMKLLELAQIVLKNMGSSWYGLPASEELDDYTFVGIIVGSCLAERPIRNPYENPFIQEMEQYQHERTMQRLEKNSVASAIYRWVEMSEGRTQEC